ncbi:MAG: phosphatidate cytidylyltransferase [Oscillibacter sp.]|nr:phosphatidate cytidylyltransferase [Oscillibacter sp.]
MKSRILVAAVGVPVLLYVVLWGPPPLLLGALALLAGIGGNELYRCVGGERDTFLAVAAVLIPCMTVEWFYDRPQYVGVWFILSTLVVFTYAVFKGGAVRFHQIAAVLFGGIAIGYSFSSFLRIYASGVSRGYLLLPFILSFACDTFAYFTGLAIGRHKLAPKVSPKKTVEGAVGGLAGNVVCGLLFVFVMRHWFYGASGILSYGAMAVLSLFCGVVAQIGDLSFSLIKREFGVKDYGKIFLAHGGVLDRFDSVLFVAPVLAALMELMQVGWRCVGG